MHTMELLTYMIAGIGFVALALSTMLVIKIYRSPQGDV